MISKEKTETIKLLELTFTEEDAKRYRAALSHLGNLGVDYTTPRLSILDEILQVILMWEP